MLPLKKRPLNALLLLVLVCAVFLAAFAARESQRFASARQRLEERIGSLDPTAFAPAAVADTDNAAMLFVKAIEHGTAAGPEAATATRRLGQNALIELNEADRSALSEFVAQHTEVLSLARRSVGKSSSSFGIDYSVEWNEAGAPEFIQLVSIAKLLLVEARLSYNEGNFVLAESNLAALHSLRTALANEPTIVSQMVAMTIDSYFLECVQLVVQQSQRNPSALDSTLALLDERDILGGLRNGLTGEALLAANWEAVSQSELPLFTRLGLKRLGAYMLDDYVSWLERDDIDRAELELELQRRAENADFKKGPLYVSYPEQLLQGLALESASELARRAIELSKDQALNKISPRRAGHTADRFSGTQPVLLAAADGSTELALPQAEEVWNRHFPPSDTTSYAPRFRWQLSNSGSGYQTGNSSPIVIDDEAIFDEAADDVAG